MKVRPRDLFTTVRTEGALLPPDLLQRIAEARDLDGLRPEDYHLLQNEKLNEAINRAWSRLLGAWASFKEALGKLPTSDPATSPTRERWLLPLFEELHFGRLPTTRAREVDGKSYPVSHLWQHTPIHLVGANIDLDSRRAGVVGAARTSPHSLVQELLNRSPDHLWGMVANGLKLRILRDNVSLTRQAYLEFDLGSMMEGEVYSDFALLWLVGHQSRFEAERPEDIWLERWSKKAQTEGTRALDTLRDGVQSAIEHLGAGFLAHPANTELRAKLRGGILPAQDYYRQLLRLVYRLIFLFVAEDRDLLFAPQADPEAKERYRSYYSVRRLRDLAGLRRGTKHPDLYQALVVVMDQLGSDEGSPQLGLPPLGSFLFSGEAMEALLGCQLANIDLLGAVRVLAFTEDGNVLRPVDYRNIGSEELGSVYESLLELHPELNSEAGTFSLIAGGGHERKTTGSYYTPTSLINVLLDSALDPVLEEAAREPDPEAAILDLKVCDPATGSGHFLVAAAHRIAMRLATVRTGDEEPAPEALRAALRDVIGRCIYGVDVNPMAVELCKVSLWMEALEPGKPLSFLDHRIVSGNSLLGATPALLEQGIPDKAFAPLEGDEKKVVSELKKRNHQERKGQTVFALGASPADLQAPIADAVEEIDAIEDASIAGVRKKEQRWIDLEGSPEMDHAKLVADAWCAAFVIPKVKGDEVLTEAVFRQLTRDPAGGSTKLKEEIREAAEQYRFFHWHLAFPEVFHVPAEGTSDQAWVGGFDLMLGNPPWERMKFQDKEWVSSRRPEIAAVSTAAERIGKIQALAAEDPRLYAEYVDATRRAEGESHFLRTSARFPLCGLGRDINSYAVFAELMRSLLDGRGRMGAILPSGIATDDTTRLFFEDLTRHRSLVSLFSFENEERIFAEVHHATKFCLLTAQGSDNTSHKASFVFFARRISDIHDPSRRFWLGFEDIAVINPNTLTAPVFRSARDADLVRGIYERVPVLSADAGIDSNWKAQTRPGLFHMANDSHLFLERRSLEEAGWTLVGNRFTRANEEYLPLLEGKMIHFFDHRFGTYEGQTRAQANQGKLPEVNDDQHTDPSFVPLPKYWVSRKEIEARVAGRWEKHWFLGWRDVTGATVLRTAIATVIPRVGVAGNLPLLFVRWDPSFAACLCANLDSFVLDYVARQKISTNHLLVYALRQLPILGPEVCQRRTQWDRARPLLVWLLPRVLELTYTAWDLVEWGRDLGCDGQPFRWDPERRALLRAELDAAFFHLYGLNRDEVGYVMDTFPIVRKNDEKKNGEYRTKRLILEVYDTMAKAIESGEPYRTILDPPPADPRVAHTGSAAEGTASHL